MKSRFAEGVTMNGKMIKAALAGITGSLDLFSIAWGN
jgi:hypothetical protein